MVCLATQVAVTYHVRETASVYAAALAPVGQDTDSPSDTARIEALEEEIVFLAAHIHAAEHRFLTLVAEYDRLRGWEVGGHRSCAHWLAFRCGYRLGAARERVRAARALADLP
ncbi:MAG: HNH endonuclease, partial [Gemmatimonadota bacterium]